MKAVVAAGGVGKHAMEWVITTKPKTKISGRLFPSVRNIVPGLPIVAQYQADDLEYGKDPFSAFILKVYRLEHVYTVNIGQCPMGMVLKELCGSFSVMNPVSQV